MKKRSALIAVLLGTTLFPAISQANTISACVSWDESNLVTWDITYDVTAGPGSAFQTMDPNTGVLGSAPFGVVAYQSWFDLGDVFGPAYVNGSFGALWHGFNGITSTDPTLGIAPDDDGATGDDFYLVQTSGNIATFTGSGSFQLLIPMASDPSAYYNVGTYSDFNGNATIKVVPEFGVSLFNAVAGFGIFWARRRRKAIG